jgi:clan AA aspartic protease (TIGR02281 family)
MYANGKGVMQDYNQALYWYRKAAAQKHAMAQFHLGHMYAQGYGVPQDSNQALQWYRKAAEQDAEIQNLLGWMYERGQHVPQNDAEAVRWYRRAAEQGDAAAQLNLAWMYGNGRGVPKSHAQAMQWYRRATERGLFNVQEDSEEGAPGNISGISSMPLTENVPPSPSARNVSPERIPLKSQGGVYTVPVEINGRLTLDFVLDTGASEVNIPVDVIRTLLRTGTVNIPEDFLPGKTYTLADGTNIPSARVTIRSLKIGQHLITNVPASIGGVQSQLLLGQSFLRRLGTWSIDNQQKVLMLSSSPTLKTPNKR